jgi:lysophospholipase L1-like esterase
MVFIGDSITDAKRGPSGEPSPGPGAPGLGHGYVSMIHAMVTAIRPADRFRVINRGVGGNTVRDLRERWRRDVLDLAPDWLSVMIGINDVWRQFDCPLVSESHIDPDEFRRTLDELLTEARPAVGRLVLVTPYVIEPRRADPMRARMDEYGAIVRGLADAHGAVLVDAQSAMDALCEAYHPMGIAWDRIHPQPPGHMALAIAWLRAVGLIDVVAPG